MIEKRSAARRAGRCLLHVAPAVVLFVSARASAQTLPAVPLTTGAPATAPVPLPAAVRASGPWAEGGLSLATGLSLFFEAPPHEDGLAIEPRTARWRGGILADEPARDAMRLRSEHGREIAASVSDGLLGALVVETLAVDVLAVPLAQGDSELALDASAAYGLALGTTLVLGEIVKAAVSRARPFERYCLEDASAPGCGNDDSISSFYSLHTAVAFTAAGFSCAMHVGRSLYGDVGTDVAACATSVVAATTVGLLRVVADRHYLTDVVVGSVVGLVVGIVVPLLLVPRRGSSVDRDAGIAPPIVLPLFAPGANGSLAASTIGLSFAGRF